ncbi:ADP-dependent NAD(P)H-hydrate dehydratase [Microterricola viridarii]|uniref:ADP-dependent (S)-NAD(P)H-hydrate dehydratase n=1 Tax=Microterricola viridarii TaxID=412690 RepID=A0A0Y0MTU7_9MICO|nr:ADP/ATP-dependent (S)-NAD(P)H-hydrate dehydratase [Microterricola viridarii]AMB57892.1 NAD(P)H-hydrate dehydratase [Microterricola viridarii]
MKTASEWLEWDERRAREWLAVPRAGDDKYSRGVLGVITGSHDYPGAAVLGVEAAMRTGVGMVRYTGPNAVRQQVLARRPEVVGVAGRVQAWLIGSGMSATRRTLILGAELGQAVAQGVPTVLDAGALDLVHEARGAVVLTPHYRELAELLMESARRAGHGAVKVTPAHGGPPHVDQIATQPALWAGRAAQQLGATVLLKGAVTYIAHPDGARFTVTGAPSWLATAGTGDVLGGILGALLATRHRTIAQDPSAVAPIAATAALVHALAARRASQGGPITALDVAGAIPATIAALLTGD